MLKATEAQKKTILVIRFSSFGDIVQALSLPSAIKQKWEGAEVHFVTKYEFASLAEEHPQIAKVWALGKNRKLRDLLVLIFQLRKISFTHIYDAHNNLRTRLIVLALTWPIQWRALSYKTTWLRKPQHRWKRFLLFGFRINTFPQPFANQRSLLEPLKKWGISTQLPPPPQIFFADSVRESIVSRLKGFKGLGGRPLLDFPLVALGPSASEELKRWPLAHWQTLVSSLGDTKHGPVHFLLLGGPADTFIEEIRLAASDRCFNFSGELSYIESAALISFSRLVIANDTGIMHIGEQLGLPTIALMGPAPFGFPSRDSTVIKEVMLSCRPCSSHGQGPCINKEKIRKCMWDIMPLDVVLAARQLLENR